MIQRLKRHISSLFQDHYFILILLLVGALIGFKWSALSVPFFSDEMWVYGPAALKMSNQLPSLLPSSLELTDHYAHPMFFFFSAGLWGNLFGASIVSMHAFSLFVSVAFLLTLYLVLKYFFDGIFAFLAVVIMAVQSIFLGQSALVLPEVMLAFFMMLTVYFYHHKRWWLYALSGTLLVLTKESGVLLIGTLFIWTLLKDFFYRNSQQTLKTSLLIYVIVVLPIVLLAAHMFMLKLNYGWYIMPDRIGHFDFDLETYYRRIRNSFHYVFIDQGRRPLIIGFAIAVSILNRNLKWWQRIGLALLMFAMMKVFFNYWKLPILVPIVVIPILSLFLLKKLVWDEYQKDNRNEILSIASIFILVFLLFSSAQFDSLRYLLCVVPFYIILSLYFVRLYLPRWKEAGLSFFSGIAVFMAVYFTALDENFGDDTLNYVKVCDDMKQAVRFLEEKGYYEESIQVPFLYWHAMERVECSYLSTNRVFEKLIPYPNPYSNNQPTIRIFDNMDGQDTYTDYLKKYNQAPIFEKQSGKYWVKIYNTN